MITSFYIYTTLYLVILVNYYFIDINIDVWTADGWVTYSVAAKSRSQSMKVLQFFYRCFGGWEKDCKGRLRKDRHKSTTCWIWLKLSGWGNWDYKQMPPCGSEPCPAMAHAYGAQRLQAGNMMRAELSCCKARNCLSHVKMSPIV